MRKHLKLETSGQHAGHGETRPVLFNLATFHFAGGVKLRPDAGTTAIEQKGSAAAHTRQDNTRRTESAPDAHPGTMSPDMQSKMTAMALSPLAHGDIVKSAVSVKLHQRGETDEEGSK